MENTKAIDYFEALKHNGVLLVIAENITKLGFDLTETGVVDGKIFFEAKGGDTKAIYAALKAFDTSHDLWNVALIPRQDEVIFRTSIGHDRFRVGLDVKTELDYRLCRVKSEKDILGART